MFYSWSGPQVLMIANLIKALWQFSQTVDGGGMFVLQFFDIIRN